MTSMKPSEFEELSLETVYSSRNGQKTSSAQVTGIVGQKKQLTSQTVYLTAVLEYMPPEIKRNNAAYLGFISARIQKTSGNCNFFFDPAKVISIITSISLLVGLYVYFTEELTGKRPKLPILFQPFDLEKNWNDLANVKRHPKAITSVDGIRVISMMLVVFGHCISNTLTATTGVWENFAQVFQEGKVLHFELELSIQCRTFLKH